MSENTDTSIANLPVVNEGRLVFLKFNLQTDSTLLIGRNSLDDRVNGAPTVQIDLHTIPDVEVPQRFWWLLGHEENVRPARLDSQVLATYILRLSVVPASSEGLASWDAPSLGCVGNVAIFPLSLPPTGVGMGRSFYNPPLIMRPPGRLKNR